MATKTISITEEAYKRLASLRKESESFSTIINRVTGKARLRELHGILSKEEGEILERSILEGRELHRKTHKRRTEQFLSQLK